MGRPSSSKLLKFSRNWFILEKSYITPTQNSPTQILTSYQIVVLAWREFFSCRIVAVEEIAKHLLHFSYLGQLHQLQGISRLRNWRWLRNSHESHLPKQLRAEMIHYDIDMSHIWSYYVISEEICNHYVTDLMSHIERVISRYYWKRSFQAEISHLYHYVVIT